MRWPRSTTARIAALTFIALLITSTVLLAFILRTTTAQLEGDARAEVRSERQTALFAFGRGGGFEVEDLVADEVRVPGNKVFLLDDGRGVKRAGNIQAWPPSLGVNIPWRQIELYREGAAESELFGVTTDRLPDGSRLLVGRSLADERRLSETLGTSLAAAVALALLLSVAATLLVTRFIDARVSAIANVADAVGDGDFSRRVPDANTGDSFDRLGTVLNVMLGRIETLLGELHAVTDGLAHDLRSPLTRLRVRIDRLARGDDTQDVALAAIAAEADTLRAMLDTALEISRAEAGIGRDSFTLVDLAAMVRDLGEMYAPLAEEREMQLTIDAPQPTPVLVHRELIGRALANLIDNALRYAASGRLIALGARVEASRALLTVADHGPGIAATDRAEALRRFGRLDAARGEGGAGLGLSLAVAVARLHDGELRLDDNAPGLCVVIDLPATSVRPAIKP